MPASRLSPTTMECLKGIQSDDGANDCAGQLAGGHASYLVISVSSTPQRLVETDPLLDLVFGAELFRPCA